MFKRGLAVMMVVGVLAAIGVSAVSADSGVISIPTTSYGDIGFINDGRLNGADLAAPVAVYYTHNTVMLPGDWTAAFHEQNVFSGIQLLAIDPVTDEGKLALSVSADQLAKIVNGPHKSVNTLVASKNGYSLYYSTTNWFWVQSPANSEGKVYTYQWQNNVIPQQ
ncbi:MAG: hypothetical protein R3E39_21865 [Anaerolineae bacterium]